MERWSGSGVIFAWDIWNEIHPSYARNTSDPFFDLVSELSEFIRDLEKSLHGRSHLQTVSIFGPAFGEYPQCEMKSTIFNHPSLDFCNVHLYDRDHIDNPQTTIEPAVVFGSLVHESIKSIKDNRPFFDSEHGPIHAFNDLEITLDERFDEEYFSRMQWVHLASGGAGGGMRWPYRHPHQLTNGMRRHQKSLSQFSNLIDWNSFDRRNITDEISSNAEHVFGCASNNQAIVFIMTDQNLELSLELSLHSGLYQCIAWSMNSDKTYLTMKIESVNDRLRINMIIDSDVCLAIR